ncbi:hypothetical protein CC79DRAFT_203842 [Sarocladium strictum]
MLASILCGATLFGRCSRTSSQMDSVRRRRQEFAGPERNICGFCTASAYGAQYGHSLNPTSSREIASSVESTEHHDAIQQ